MASREGPGLAAATWTLRLYLLGAAALGVSALYGGGMLIMDPSGGRLAIPLSYLEGSPFGDYLVPGLVLFTAFGVGSVVVIAGLVRRLRSAWLAALGLGAGQVGWILVQIAIIGEVNGLHLLYGGLGLALAALAATPSFRASVDAADAHG